jgi:hypothetical protein
VEAGDLVHLQAAKKPELHDLGAARVEGGQGGEGLIQGDEVDHGRFFAEGGEADAGPPAAAAFGGGPAGGVDQDPAHGLRRHRGGVGRILDVQAFGGEQADDRLVQNRGRAHDIAAALPTVQVARHGVQPGVDGRQEGVQVVGFALAHRRRLARRAAAEGPGGRGAGGVGSFSAGVRSRPRRA